MSMGNKMSQKLKEHKCLLAEIRPETDKTPWRKVSEVSPCPFDETEPLTQPTTSAISTNGSTTTKSVTGKPVDKKHMKAHGGEKGGQDDANKESTTRMSSHRDGTRSMNQTNKTVAKKQLDKPEVNEDEQVTEPSIRSTTMKGQRKPLAEKLVNTTDPPKIDKGDEGEMNGGDGGSSGIIQANSVMLVITMHFIN